MNRILSLVEKYVLPACNLWKIICCNLGKKISYLSSSSVLCKQYTNTPELMLAMNNFVVKVK